MASSSDPARLLAVDQHQYHQLLHNQLHQNHHQYPHYPRLKSSASSASLRSREGGTPPPATAAAAPATPTTAAAMDNSANASGSGNVKVVVRVRAFLPREYQRDAPCLIEMDPETQETHLNPPPPDGRHRTKVCERKSFTFDNSFCSIDPHDPCYADQEDVYDALGQEFLDHNFQGYHTCIFAYGQTGAGKSYSMMGTPDHPGLIPRTCRDLFRRIEDNHSPNVSYTVRVSYFEVYNEHVRDLLVSRRDTPYNLKVRESPTDGPYIKDLTEVPVRGIQEVLRWMKLGDKSRTVASTNMNDTSSRSHAVFTLLLKQIECSDGDETTERVARIRLVDLAGSERANSTGASGARLREGSNINKSLTTLGRVIAALADDGKRLQARKKDVVPYRDSILTWLLKDSLGGNSKTAMIACISPTDYEETLSTLRYANQAKRIRTSARINQDQVSQAERDAQIKGMQDTIRMLQMSVSAAAMNQKQAEIQAEQLDLYQQEVQRMQRKMEEAREVAECKIKALQTQNEALKLHLRLAIESLKNPIPAVVTPSDWDDEYDSDDTVSGDGHDDDDDDDDDGGGDDDNGDQVTEEVELRMSELLSDLGVFRRKMVDDKSRFLPVDTKREAMVH